MSHAARRMWTLFEPVHAITYFAPESRAAFEAAGLRGFWRGYFAGRAAPLGTVGAAAVQASFFSFAPRMVTRALPDVWTRATPETSLEARRAGARTALDKLIGDAGGKETDWTEAADLMRAAAGTVGTAGRVLGAANAALPWPDEPLDVIWHAATILREHRGDGHIAALVGAEVDGCEALIWQVAAGRGAGREFLQPARGWDDDEWAAAGDRLAGRGWLDGSGAITDTGRQRRDAVEEDTDRMAAGPWRDLGAARTERCAELLAPLAAAVAPVLIWPNPIGVPDPRGAGA
jgi:hypothetical protein